jgi:adenylate kinase
MLNLILFGPPGAGKGTQSQHLINRHQLIHLSTGDLLRSEITQGTQLGLEAKALMDEGKLVPDAIVIGMIESKLNEYPKANGFIFDGFPRTTAQAAALDNLLNGKSIPISLMIALEVPEQELIDRLVSRGLVSGRTDDTPETIKKRLDVYRSQTSIVSDHYKQQNKFVAISGVGELEDVFDRIEAEIKKIV